MKPEAFPEPGVQVPNLLLPQGPGFSLQHPTPQDPGGRASSFCLSQTQKLAFPSSLLPEDPDIQRLSHLTLSPRLMMLRMHNLHGTKPPPSEDSDEEEEEDEEDEEERKPQLELAMVPHYGGINRVRVRTV